MQVEPVLWNMNRSSAVVVNLSLHSCWVHVVKNWMAIVIDRLMRRVSLRYGFLRIRAPVSFPLKVVDVIIIVVSELLLILENLVLLLILLLLLMVEHG